MEGCIEWTGSIHANGYGQRYSRETKNTVRAHRAAYCEYHGLKLADIKGKMVLHKCDNRPCVNPEHLYLGDHAQNMADRSNRKRQVVGSRTGRSKLSQEQVEEIRSTYQKGVKPYDQPSLAKAYGVSQATISKIVLNKDWRHI